MCFAHLERSVHTLFPDFFVTHFPITILHVPGSATQPLATAREPAHNHTAGLSCQAGCLAPSPAPRFPFYRGIPGRGCGVQLPTLGGACVRAEPSVHQARVFSPTDQRRSQRGRGSGWERKGSVAGVEAAGIRATSLLTVSLDLSGPSHTHPTSI